MILQTAANSELFWFTFPEFIGMPLYFHGKWCMIILTGVILVRIFSGFTKGLFN